MEFRHVSIQYETLVHKNISLYSFLLLSMIKLSCICVYVYISNNAFILVHNWIYAWNWQLKEHEIPYLCCKYFRLGEVHMVCEHCACHCVWQILGDGILLLYCYKHLLSRVLDHIFTNICCLWGNLCILLIISEQKKEKE